MRALGRVRLQGRDAVVAVRLEFWVVAKVEGILHLVHGDTDIRRLTAGSRAGEIPRLGEVHHEGTGDASAEAGFSAPRLGKQGPRTTNSGFLRPKHLPVPMR